MPAKTKLKKKKPSLSQPPVVSEEVIIDEESETPREGRMVVEEIKEQSSHALEHAKSQHSFWHDTTIPESSTQDMSENPENDQDLGSTFDEDSGKARVAFTEKIGQNTRDTMEPQQDLRRPESEQPLWSDSPSGAKKKGNNGLLIGIIVVLVLLAAGAGGYFWNLRSQEGAEAQVDETSQITEPSVEISPTPTAPEVKRSEWTIDVQNGTQTPGLAKKVADELEALGYTVGKIGNADSSSYTSSELHVSTSDQTAAEGLITDFKTYGVSTLAADLTTSTSMTAKLIIGDNYSGASTDTSSDTTSTDE